MTPLMPEVDPTMQGYSVLIISMHVRWPDMLPHTFPHVNNHNIARLLIMIYIYPDINCGKAVIICLVC